MNYEKQADAIVDYFKRAEKKPEDFKLGIELEHFILDRDSLKTVSYYGPKGVGETLAEIRDRLDFVPSGEGEYILGLNKGDYAITTEPGSQFELSITAQKCVSDINKKYVEFMQQVVPIFQGKNQEVAALGYHPVTKIDDIKMLPKKRYDFMYNYFKTRGSRSHNMMKGTAALQVSIDFESEEDFIRKYRVGNALSPILYTMFDNAYIFEGEVYGHRNLRQNIWQNTDKDRSGVVPFAFDEDLSYRRYAEYILNSPVIFMEEQGNYIDAGDRPFKEFYNPDKHGDDVIYHALSIVFPDIRLKRYLEFRMMDAVNYPINMSAVALIKGLLYSETNLKRLETSFKDITYDKMMEGKTASGEKGLEGIYLGKTIQQWSQELIEMAREELEYDDARFLRPLQDLIDRELNPRNIFEKKYREKGLRNAVETSFISRMEGVSV